MARHGLLDTGLQRAACRVHQPSGARPGLADAVIRAAAGDPKLCRLFARVALGEDDLRARRLEIAARMLLAALRGRIGFPALVRR